MVGTSAYLASTIGVWLWCRMRFFDRNPDLFRHQYLSEYKKRADEEAKRERVKTGLKDFERQRAQGTAPTVQIAPVAGSGSSSGAASWYWCVSIDWDAFALIIVSIVSSVHTNFR